ncbi:general transcription factor 3C polypeptide 3-like isoform X2 [Varroa destructor]|uniref:General transcription factor 3C polypeptide 3 n=1 Tax=Varroa destructor TaxID=109461 RepID=A0A7M7MJL6_VARDE|nr:general transcription factor 3C polypeptide 3-like isoform X2 [Varroa destructor]
MDDDPFRALFGSLKDPRLEEIRKAVAEVDAENGKDDPEEMEINDDYDDADDDDDQNEVSLDVVDETEAISRVIQKLPDALNQKARRIARRRPGARLPLEDDFVGLDSSSSESEDYRDDDKDKDYEVGAAELRRLARERRTQRELERDSHASGEEQPDGPSQSRSDDPLGSTIPHDAYEITRNFLEGTISFTDFAEQMDVEDDEGENSGADSDVEADNEPATSTRKTTETKKPTPTRGPRIRRFKKLPRDLQGSLGQASLHLAAGCLDKAIEKCMEVIRIAPDAADAYKTLGTIYMQQGDDLKALQVSMIGAYLRPKDAQEWHRLATWSIDLGDREQALLCLKKAVKADPDNAEFYLDIVTLASELGNHLDCFRYGAAVIPRFSENQAQMCIQLSRTIAQIQYKYGKPKKGAEVLELAFQRFPQSISSEDVHMLLEIQVEAKQFSKAMRVLVSHCGVELTPIPEEFSDENTPTDTKISLLNCKSVRLVELPLDILAKAVICMAHLGGVHLAKEIMGPIARDGDIEVMGDLVFDMAEAFEQSGEVGVARELCDLLLRSQRFNIAGVWWLLAQCLVKDPEQTENAIQAYEKVLEMAPDHADARLMFSKFLESIGRKRQASEVLRETRDLKLVKRRFDLALAGEDMDEFCGSLFRLLSLATVYLPEDLKLPMLCEWTQAKGRIDFIKAELAKRGIPNDFPSYRPNRTEFHAHIKKALAYLLREGKLELYLDICSRASIIYALHDSLQDSYLLHLITLVGAMRLRLDEVCFQALRTLCRSNPLSRRLWNIFNILVNRTLIVRHNN